MFFGYQARNFASRSGSSRRETQSRLVQQAANLIGYHVKINRGGPDSVDGVLIAIPSDYLVLATDQGVIYVNAAHVKSITEVSRAVSGQQARSGSSGYVRASSFNSLLSKLRHQFIQVNRGGPEKIEGFLAETTSDYLLIVVNRELVRIPTFHIKTVNVTTKNKSGQKNNKSGGNARNRSGGGQSGGRSRGNQSGGRGRSGRSGR